MKPIKYLVALMVLLVAVPFALADNVTDEIENEFEEEIEEIEDELEETLEEIADDLDDENADNLDDEDENVVEEGEELLSFNTSNGAKVRLLQLEKAIQKNIIKGDEAINNLEDVNNESLTELTNILLSMEELKEEVANYELQGHPEDAHKFVEFRQDASALTKKFRETISEFVSEQKREEIKQKINERIRNQEALGKYKEAIHKRARQHNEEVTRNTASALGIASEDLLERIKTQNITPKEIREEIVKAAKQLRNQSTNKILEDLKEEALRKRIQVREEHQKIAIDVINKQQERIRERIKNINESEDIRKRVEEGLAKSINNIRPTI